MPLDATEPLLPSSNPLDRETVDSILDENRVAEFNKLRGVPGICLDPLPWETIEACVEENTVDSLGKLGRHPAGIVEYRRFRKQVLEQYDSVADYVKINILQYQSKVTAEGKKGALNGSCQSNCPVWRENDFPYNFTPGIKHVNVWSHIPLTESELAEEVKSRMKGQKCLVFVNPVPLASVPTIWHAHIICRADNDSNQSQPRPQDYA